MTLALIWLMLFVTSFIISYTLIERHRAREIRKADQIIVLSESVRSEAEEIEAAWDQVLVTADDVWARFDLPRHLKADFAPAAMPCLKAVDGEHRWGEPAEAEVTKMDGSVRRYAWCVCEACGTGKDVAASIPKAIESAKRGDLDWADAAVIAGGYSSGAQTTTRPGLTNAELQRRIERLSKELHATLRMPTSPLKPAPRRRSELWLD